MMPDIQYKTGISGKSGTAVIAHFAYYMYGSGRSICRHFNCSARAVREDFHFSGAASRLAVLPPFIAQFIPVRVACLNFKIHTLTILDSLFEFGQRPHYRLVVRIFIRQHGPAHPCGKIVLEGFSPAGHRAEILLNLLLGSFNLAFQSKAAPGVGT